MEWEKRPFYKPQHRFINLPMKEGILLQIFPDTPWEELTGVEINAVVKEGATSNISIRKLTTRWRGNDIRKKRVVKFLDLKRITPIYSKQGYLRLAKRNLHETSSKVYTPDVLQRLSQIIGKSYTLAKQAKTNADQNRSIPVLGINEEEYSGFHQGAGESTITELLGLEIPQYSLILIDEIETSLHPSAQRRLSLIRDLATVSRIKKVQFIVTTHSYIGRIAKLRSDTNYQRQWRKKNSIRSQL